jgi:hypothetical protein
MRGDREPSWRHFNGRKPASRELPVRGLGAGHTALKIKTPAQSLNLPMNKVLALHSQASPTLLLLPAKDIQGELAADSSSLRPFWRRGYESLRGIVRLPSTTA